VQRRWSLITRLMGWQVLASLLALVLVTGFIMFEKLKSETGYLDERMRFFAGLLVGAVASERSQLPGLAQRVDAFQHVLDEAFKSIEYESNYPLLAQVFSHDGQLVYSSPHAPKTPLLLPLRPATLQAKTVVFSDGQVAGDPYRLLQVTSRDGDSTLVMAESVAARRAVIWPLLAGLALKQFVALLLCLGALWWATRSMLRPLAQLTIQMTQRQPGTLTPFDVRAPDPEVALLVDSLNRLMRAEAQRRDMERGFLADAAHELRTPLALLAAQAHLVLNAQDEQARTAAAQALRQGLARASHTLTQLLTVARVDATASPTTHETVDTQPAPSPSPSPYASKALINLSELVAERVAHFTAVARAKWIDLELQGADDEQVWANAPGLITILDNLLDNAVRYTPNNGNVVVSLRNLSDGTEVVVQDDGPGIPVEHHVRVFERFFRMPGNLAPGTGLGLAIAQAIAHAQGATLALGPGLNGNGLGVTLRLTLHSPPKRVVVAE
jgi:signal transduction histidine kinase